jgi:phasin family protein
MTDPNVEKFTNESAAAFSKGAQTAQNLVKDGANALSESGKGSAAAVVDLTKAYQELAARNIKKLTEAVATLAAAKSPTEFFELQQKLIKDNVESAVNDTRHISELTTAIFTAAFEPVKKQIEAAQNANKI